jgi:hypothetical protein
LPMIDHKVSFRSQETLMAYAMRQREKLCVDHLCELPVRQLIERYLRKDPSDTERPRLILFDHDREPFFNRKLNTLNVNRELWDEAGFREPLACFKLVHELAHILLHRHPKVSFSRSEYSQLSFADDEESAEWQANVFAALFIAPPYLANGCNAHASFLERFLFPPEFVEFWFRLRERRPLRFSVELCPRCGSQHAAIIGDRFRCDNCGQIFE